MKTLFVSNLFPDQSQPIWGLDNAVILGHLNELHEVRVLATRFDPFVARSKDHLKARPEDLKLKPTYLGIPYLPKIGTRTRTQLYQSHLIPHLRKIHLEFPFDRLLCAWLFPDGCAVGKAATTFNVPFALIAQGSDVHQYLNDSYRKKRIIDTANRSLGVITRSADLGHRLQTAGVEDHKTFTVYNGIDHALFCPSDKERARTQLALPSEEQILLFVGNLLPIKRPQMMIEALAELITERQSNKFRLVMIGGGPLRAELEQMTRTLKLKDRIQFQGQVPPETIATFMQAADVLTLASVNEGVPNVILEALASGLPVVAPKVGGIHEIINQPQLGTLDQIDSAADLARAWGTQLAKEVDTPTIANYAKQFSWQKAASKYDQILSGAS